MSMLLLSDQNKNVCVIRFCILVKLDNTLISSSIRAQQQSHNIISMNHRRLCTITAEDDFRYKRFELSSSGPHSRVSYIPYTDMWKKCQRILTPNGCMFFPLQWGPHNDRLKVGCTLVGNSLDYVNVKNLLNLTFSEK